MEYREHEKLHLSKMSQESSLPEKLVAAARDIYDNLTSGMRRSLGWEESLQNRSEKENKEE